MKATEELLEKDLIIEAVENHRYRLSTTSPNTEQGRAYLEIKSERLKAIIDRLKTEADLFYYYNIGQIEISRKELLLCQDLALRNTNKTD